MIDMIDTIATTETRNGLSDRVRTAIQSSPFLPRRNLRFEAEHGRVILRGEVASFYQKQMAQECLRDVDGVTAIENQLEVACL